MDPKIAFMQAIKTPNGPGLLIGQDPGAGLVLVSHRPADVPEPVRVEYWRGGPCFSIWYELAELQLQPAAGQD